MTDFRAKSQRFDTTDISHSVSELESNKFVFAMRSTNYFRAICFGCGCEKVPLDFATHILCLFVLLLIYQYYGIFY